MIFTKYPITITKNDVMNRWGDIPQSLTGGFWQRKLRYSMAFEINELVAESIKFCYLLCNNRLWN